MHYYQHNIADYRKDTTHLSMLEHGAYRQLLDWAYLEQSPIPKETKVVFRRLRAITDEEQKAVLNCLNEFFSLTDDGYIQGRVSSEITAYEAKSSTARGNGKLGGRPLKTKVVISGNPDKTQTKANSLTHKLINSYTPIAPKGVAERFERFWSAYPKKTGKDAARKCFEKRKPEELLLTKMLDALTHQSASREWQKDGGQYIPNPATWLNQGRWQDESDNYSANGQEVKFV